MLPPPPPPPPPLPRRRRPEMPSSPTQSQEMSELHLKIHKGALTCMFCLHPLYDAVLRPCSFMCDGGHIYCHRCTQRHKKKCSSLCIFLEKITAQMKVKCNLCDSGYMPYRKFVGHLCDPPVHPELVDRQLYSDFELGDCTLDPNLLVCSECNHLLQLPIFMHVYDRSLVCGACYGNDIGIYIHHKELEYIVQRISVKCMACEEYLPFCALALHQVDDCPFKHKLQKIAPSSSARKNLCGKNKQKASYELGKMDKHIVQGDVVGNDDDSSDDNIPESGMRVAENSKTFACNKKVKIAAPHGQKTGAPTAAQDGASTSRCLPITAPSKPAPYKPCRPGTRLFEAANNRNRGRRRRQPRRLRQRATAARPHATDLPSGRPNLDEDTAQKGIQHRGSLFFSGGVPRKRHDLLIFGWWQHNGRETVLCLSSTRKTSVPRKRHELLIFGWCQQKEQGNCIVSIKH